MVRNATGRLALIGALAAGCAPGAGDPGPTIPEIRPVTIVASEPGAITPASAIVREIPIVADVDEPTGIALDDSGRRLVVTRNGTIHELGETTVLWRAAAAEEPFGFTDIVALDDGRVAVTSVGDGFVVELESGAMYQHFCYEPGWMEPSGQDPVQVSFGVARDPLGHRLYAQPRTIEESGLGAVTASFVAAYDESIGADVAWWSLPVDFVSFGMTLLEQRDETSPRLLLARATVLHRFDVATGELRAVSDLGELGIADVAGIALDAEADTLLVLDAARRTVVEIRTSALPL